MEIHVRIERIASCIYYRFPRRFRGIEKLEGCDVIRKEERQGDNKRLLGVPWKSKGRCAENNNARKKKDGSDKIQDDEGRIQKR